MTREPTVDTTVEPARLGREHPRTLGSRLGSFVIKGLVLSIVAAGAFGGGYFFKDREDLLGRQGFLQQQIAAQDRIAALEKRVAAFEQTRLDKERDRATIVELDLKHVFLPVRQAVARVTTVRLQAIAQEITSELIRTTEVDLQAQFAAAGLVGEGTTIAGLETESLVAEVPDLESATEPLAAAAGDTGDSDTEPPAITGSVPQPRWLPDVPSSEAAALLHDHPPAEFGGGQGTFQSNTFSVDPQTPPESGVLIGPVVGDALQPAFGTAPEREGNPAASGLERNVETDGDRGRWDEEGRPAESPQGAAADADDGAAESADVNFERHRESSSGSETDSRDAITPPADGQTSAPTGSPGEPDRLSPGLLDRVGSSHEEPPQ
jgi:hypothetical protein